jgi:hypothetical protein
MVFQKSVKPPFKLFLCIFIIFMRFEALMVVKIPLLVIWVEVDTNVSGEHTAYIFRTEEVATSAMKMEAVCSPETMVSAYKSTWHYNPED